MIRFYEAEYQCNKFVDDVRLVLNKWIIFILYYLDNNLFLFAVFLGVRSPMLVLQE